MGARQLAVSAGGRSDANGNLTVTFANTPPGFVDTGTVFIANAPAGAQVIPTVASTPQFGYALGGQAIAVQVVDGDTLTVSAIGLPPLTNFTAYFNGTRLPVGEVNNWLAPFPATPPLSVPTASSVQSLGVSNAPPYPTIVAAPGPGLAIVLFDVQVSTNQASGTTTSNIILFYGVNTSVGTPLWAGQYQFPAAGALSAPPENFSFKGLVIPPNVGVFAQTGGTAAADFYTVNLTYALQNVGS